MMPKRRLRFPELLLGILLSVAIFAMGMMFGSSQQQADRPNTHSAEASNKPNPFTIGWVVDDGTVFFTAILALVAIAQGTLFYWQLTLIKGSLKPAEDAAKAAKLSADSVISAERAYVFIEIRMETVADIIKYMQALNSVAPRPILIQYLFTNHGKTPAIIRAISYGAVVAENLPRQREYTQVLHLPTHLLGADKSTNTLEYEEFNISSAIANSIRDLKVTFWFYGEIVYDDMFDRERTLNFVFHVNGISEGFTLYRYEETEEKRKS
jgi:hypothetical protein